MSSVIDGFLNSDRQVNGSSDAAQQGTRRYLPTSSPHPRAPPSESAGPRSDIGGFADDEVVGLRGNRKGYRPKETVEKVVDRVGEMVGKQFEQFLEKYVSMEHVKYLVLTKAIFLKF